MSRVILVLFIAAVVFVLVWFFAPDLIQQYLPQAAAPTAPAEESAKATTPATAAKATARKRPVSIPGESSKAQDIRSDAVAPVPALGNLPQPSITPGPTHPAKPVFSVTTEMATLYSTNASVGPVVSHLRKGEIVEPQFILNSAGQEWMFVSVADRRVSGFMRVENLAKKQADQTSR